MIRLKLGPTWFSERFRPMVKDVPLMKVLSVRIWKKKSPTSE